MVLPFSRCQPHRQLHGGTGRELTMAVLGAIIQKGRDIVSGCFPEEKVSTIEAPANTSSSLIERN